MDEVSSYYKLSQLIAKYLIEDIEIKDRQELENWLNQDDANLQLFNRLIENGSFEKWEETINSVNAEKGWSELEEVLEIKQKKGLRIYSITKYAAVFLLLIAISYLIVSNVQKNRTGEEIIQASVIPLKIDSTEIILQLANGELINLESKAEQTVVDDNQVAINLKKGNKLEYIPKDGGIKEIQLNHIFVPYGKTINISLSDGTKVWLNAGTQFTYPVVFTGDTREVKLNGEGYFEVAKNKGKPFEVKTNDIFFRVLGTSFNINCFPDDNVAEAVLVTGSLAIYKANTDYSDKVAVKIVPNEKASYSLVNKSMTIEKADTHNYTAWKDGMFVFRNETFTQISKRLERTYNVEIECEYPALLKDRFVGQFDNETIEDVLESFKINRNFNYKIDGKKIIITN